MLVRALRAVSASIASGASHRVMAVRSVAVDKGADGAQLLELFIAQYREIRRSVAHGAFILKLALPAIAELGPAGLDQKINRLSEYLRIASGVCVSSNWSVSEFHSFA